ncbi:MAG: DUF2889 domain-containing protein [Candidatus Rokubacteria bacterium]|nr:DUF2889 domain-containing protein [Candidatus Rokubacteria bacterium]
MSEAGRQSIQLRTISAEAWKVSDTELEVTGRLVDDRPQGGPRWFDEGHGTTIHDMSLTIRVRYPDLVITGLSVAQGFTRAVNERFGRQAGCAHLTALIQALGPVVRQAAGAAFRDESAPPRADRDLWFVNTCQAWRAGGPLHARLVAGDVAGMKALSARQREG